MALGPIDPFQNVLSADVEPPDEIFLIVRPCAVLGQDEETNISTNADTADCNPSPGPEVKFAFWTEAQLMLAPSFYQPSAYPAELSDVLYKPPVAVSEREKEEINYAVSLDDVNLLNTTVDDVDQDSQEHTAQDNDQGGRVLRTPASGSFYSVTQEQCISTNFDMPGIAVGEDGAPFSECFEVISHSFDGQSVSFDYEFYGPVSARRYNVGGSQYRSGASPGRGSVVSSGTVTFDLFADWRDEPFNIRYVSINYGGEEVQYQPIEEADGDFVYKVLNAEGEIVRNDVPGIPGAKALYRFPRAIVLRLKKRFA